MKNYVLFLPKVKRIFTTVLLMVITLLLVSGCSSDNSQITNGAENEYSSYSTEVESQVISEEEDEDMPYIDTNIKYDLSDNITTVDPWTAAPYLLDSVKRLTVEDLTGEVTFIEGSIYSFIKEDGTRAFPPSLPVGDDPPKTAELYLASTDAVLALKEGDIIALAAIKIHPSGATQKIMKIHKTNGKFVHFTTQSSVLEETFDKEGFKKAIEENNNQSSPFDDPSYEDDYQYSDWITFD